MTGTFFCSCVKLVKRRPSTSLANYDIGMLIAWHTAVREAYGTSLRIFLLPMLKQVQTSAETRNLNLLCYYTTLNNLTQLWCKTYSTSAGLCVSLRLLNGVLNLIPQPSCLSPTIGLYPVVIISFITVIPPHRLPSINTSSVARS